MMMKKTEAVIFDLDGVLVSTDRFHYLAWKRLADQLGIRFDAVANERCRGVSREESLEILLETSEKNYTEEEKKKFLELKNSWYREYLETMTSADVPDGIRKVLHRLRKSGYRLAVGSSSRNALLILERTDLLREFDAVADGNDIKKSKPDPEVFLKAAEFLNVDPDGCLVVEDAEAGVKAAHAAGMKAAVVRSGAGIPGADYVLEHPEDIAEILEKEKIQ